MKINNEGDSMSVIMRKTNLEMFTFGQALELYGTSEEISKKIDGIATQILNRTLRSSDPEEFKNKPFEGLISILFRLNPDIDLTNVPMEAESVLKQLKTQPTLFLGAR